MVNACIAYIACFSWVMEAFLNICSKFLVLFCVAMSMVEVNEERPFSLLNGEKHTGIRILHLMVIYIIYCTGMVFDLFVMRCGTEGDRHIFHWILILCVCSLV